jgi:predicted nucleotidyltransferase component of viral defense system
MIDVSEIKRIAGSLGLNPTVVEHDYVLGCYLHLLGDHERTNEQWVFKGGTALRKCYFENYRFSEDLDFTLTQSISIDEVKKFIIDINGRVKDKIGIITDLRNMSAEVIEDEYGKESYEIKIYYSGPWNYGGSPRSLQIHLNRDEEIIFPPNRTSIMHDYSDRDELPETLITVYSLEEVLSEKLRAVSGQRRYAISRDIYDINFIIGQKVDIEKSINALPKKCEIKGIDIKSVRIENFIKRKDEYKTNWDRNLRYLIPSSTMVEFEGAWNSTVNILKEALMSP